MIVTSDGARPAATAAAWMRARYSRTLFSLSGASASWMSEFAPANASPRPDPPGEAITGSPRSNGTAFSGPSNA